MYLFQLLETNCYIFSLLRIVTILTLLTDKKYIENTYKFNFFLLYFLQYK